MSRSFLDVTVNRRLYGNVGVGKVIFVDPVLGDDTKGAVNQSPFASLTAAISASGAAAPCTIRLAPGNYSTVATVPANVALQGSGTSNTTISVTVAGAGSVITFAGQNAVSDLSVAITLFATSAYNITAIYLNGNATNMTQLSNVNVTITSPASLTGSGTITAIQCNCAAGQSTTFRNVIATATSATPQTTTAYAINSVGSATGSLVLQNCVLTASATAGVAYGLSTTPVVGSYNNVFTGTTQDVLGVSNPSVVWRFSVATNSLVSGIVAVPNTAPSFYQFGTGGQLPTGTWYALPGSLSYGTSEVALTLPHKGILCAMSVGLSTSPSTSSATANVAVTIRKNKAFSAATATVTGTSAVAAYWTGAVAFAAGDSLSVAVVASSDATAAADLQVVLGFI